VNEPKFVVSVEFLPRTHHIGQVLAFGGEQYRIIYQLSTETYTEAVLELLPIDNRIPDFLAFKLNIKPRPANNLSN
jgi:hypothetical protein